MRRPLALPPLLAALLLLAGCPDDEVDSCSPEVEKGQLAARMYEWYLYTEHLPENVVLGDYETTQDLLDAMTAPAREAGVDRPGWTYLTTRAATSTLFEEGTAVGFGVSLLERDGRIRLSQVFPLSPADDAGFARGDELLRIAETEAGLALPAAVVTPDDVGALLGPSTAGVTRFFEVLPRDEGATPVVRGPVTKRVFGLDPVPVVVLENGQRWRIFDRGGKKLGYVALRTFIEPADPLLGQAFQAFQDAGVTDVVVDLRYNGGGLVSTGELLANLLGGGLAGQTMLQVRNNLARAAAFDELGRFGRPQGTGYVDVPSAIAPTSVAFITTDSSASASELVPNVLEPYLSSPGAPPRIAIVGAKTHGKPVGQRGFRIGGCETLAFLVSFRIENRQGDGSYFDGLPDAAGDFAGPLCPALDDLDDDPGSELEASTAEALTFLETGACTPTPAPAAKPGLAAAAARRPDSYPAAPEPSLAQRHLSGLF